MPFAINGFMVVTYCFLISTAKSLPQFVYDANSHIILTHEINSTLYLLVRQRLSLALLSYWRNLLSSCDNPPLERNHSYSGNKIILFENKIILVGLIYLPTSLFQTNRTFSHKVEIGTLQTNHRLEFNRIFSYRL